VAQDTGLSSRQHGFEFHWGHFYKHNPAVIRFFKSNQ
jgi:hypothetical protein